MKLIDEVDNVRYGMACFDYPEVKASVSISGPQSAEQVPEEIRTILDMEYVTQVLVFREIDGRKCGQSFNKIKE